MQFAEDRLSFSQDDGDDMSRLQLTEGALRAVPMSYASTRIHEDGEVDLYVLDCGLQVEVELAPGPGEDRFTTLSFDHLRVRGSAGQAVALLSEAGDELDEEALQVIIWERLETFELCDGYMQGRQALAAAMGEIIRIDLGNIPEHEPDPELA